MKIRHLLTIAFGATFLLATIPDADAATIRVRCKKESGSHISSHISVDGNNLRRGSYKARVISGAKRKTSPLQQAVSGEVEFDFDSDPNDIAEGATNDPRDIAEGATSDPGDIAEGATPIGANFIRRRTVTGKIINSAGFTVISDTVTCRLKKQDGDHRQ